MKLLDNCCMIEKRKEEQLQVYKSGRTGRGDVLCSDDRERAVAMRSEISSLLLLGGVYETMSITVAMRESRREKEPTVCARTARIQHNLEPRCRSELLSSGFLDAIAISLSVARRDASPRTKTEV